MTIGGYPVIKKWLSYREHRVLGTDMLGPDAPTDPRPWPEGTEEIVLAGGCFWGIERIAWQVPGVHTTSAGYAGGFFIGWLFRKFIKTALLVSGGLLALLAVARKLGWFEADWTSLEGYLRDSFAWIGGHAGSFKNFLTGYLPSAGAAALGFFFGVWSD